MVELRRELARGEQTLALVAVAVAVAAREG